MTDTAHVPGKDSTAARRARARSLFAQGMPQALGVRVVSLSAKRVVAEMPIRDMHLNRNGRVNGGALMAFADILGAAGSVLVRPLGTRGGTLESKTNFFASALGPVLRGVSEPLHVGRTTSVWQTSIYNPDGKLVAIVTQTQMGLPREPGGT